MGRYSVSWLDEGSISAIPLHDDTTCPLIAIFISPVCDEAGTMRGVMEGGAIRFSTLFFHVIEIPILDKACPTYQTGTYVEPFTTKPLGFDISFPFR